MRIVSCKVGLAHGTVPDNTHYMSASNYYIIIFSVLIH